MRKSLIYIGALVFLVAAACNFPVRSLTKTPGSTLTASTQIFQFQPTAAPTPTLPPAALSTRPPSSPTLSFDPSLFVSYAAQPGDSLAVVAAHFGVTPDQIRSDQPLPAAGLLPVNQALIIPKPAQAAPFTQFLLPDSEIVNSSCGTQFDLPGYVQKAGGKLSSYSQYLNNQTLPGAAIVRLVEDELSVNPNFLLAFIEFRSQWVLGHPNAPDMTFPLGLNIQGLEGLYNELSTAAKLLNMGYYGWRYGTMSTLDFPDGGSVRIAPALNAGTVGLQYLFARLYHQADWEAALYGPNGFLVTYQKMFGDPMACARTVEPLFPNGLAFPILELPFAAGEDWALTGGLHEDWNTGTPPGALDFAPITGEPPCAVSRAWVRASAAGIITRSENGALQEALVDGAGSPTGWELLYMHVADQDRAAVGAHVSTNDPLGHPSCEGGVATGTHVHLARLYRGEWIGAGDLFPYILSGWLAVPGPAPYHSTLVKGDQVVSSDPNGMESSRITR